MKYNTRSVKNITETKFVGTYAGVDIVFEPSQTRHLPSSVAIHIGQQLATMIFKKQDRRNSRLVKGLPEILDSILSPEIQTKEEEKNLSPKEEIEQHEKEFAQYLDKKRDEEILKREEALS